MTWRPQPLFALGLIPAVWGIGMPIVAMVGAVLIRVAFASRRRPRTRKPRDPSIR